MSEFGYPTLLYHERQVAALCGQHCLNTLLQGPYFTEIDLAQIAQDLDALEQSVMSELGQETPSYKKWQEEASGNVAADGMFSIQVLSKALSNWDLTCTNLNSPEALNSREQPNSEQGFICNLHEHWLTLRKVDWKWYNFNSLSAAPDAVGDTYLKAFLATLTEEGYSIFVVQGQLPQPHPDAGNPDSPGRWFTPEEAKNVAKEAANVKTGYKSLRDRATENGTLMTLRAPQQQSVGGKREREVSQSPEADNDLAWAIAASLGRNAEAGPSASESEAQQTDDCQEAEDPDLAAAIAASLRNDSKAGGSTPVNSAPAHPILQDPGAEPPSGPDTLTLAIRLLDGKRVLRRFQRSDSLSTVFSYIQSEGVEVHGTQLTAFPAKVFANTTESLEAAGICDKESLALTKKRL